jgi:ubiquinone/menaquinone biosynthesis C-methylase UbiE
MLQPARGERLLDAGSGTGIFTRSFLDQGAAVTGLDISWAMLRRGLARSPFPAAVADMTALPFCDAVFDQAVSVAALEFIADGRLAVAELFRVTRPGGRIVVATLNRLSPWAERRREQARHDPASIFRQVYFRSPQEVLALAPVAGEVRTAIHFAKDEEPGAIDRVEGEGAGRETGAFVAACWEKP